MDDVRTKNGLIAAFVIIVLFVIIGFLIKNNQDVVSSFFEGIARPEN